MTDKFQRKNLQAPYWYADDSLPGLDICRQIVEPGNSEKFPDGAVALYVDDNFWCVAAVPLEYRDTPVQEIAEELWPEYKDQLEYIPDHGTIELDLYFAKGQVRHLRSALDELHVANSKLHAENERYRLNRQGPECVLETRQAKTSNYFIRQYEYLLAAMAHEFVACEAPKAGVCSSCGLLKSDRVHSQKWIDKVYDPLEFLNIPSQYPDADPKDE